MGLTTPTSVVNAASNLFQGTLTGAQESGGRIFGGLSVSSEGRPSDIARAGALAFHDVDGGNPIMLRNRTWRKRRVKSKFAKRSVDFDDLFDDFDVDEATREERISDRRYKRHTVEIAKQVTSRSIITARR